MSEKYDIIIIGGGVAGLTCAWRLSQNTDAGIALLEEKGRVGRNVTPGTLNMEFVNRLKGWGFAKAIESTYTSLGLYTADESARFGLGGKPIGASINYGKFCGLLAKKATGVDIFAGTRAETIEKTTSSIGINGEFEAGLVIDCSGAGLLAQKMTGARPPGKYSIVRGARLSGCSVGDREDEMSLILDSPYCTGGGWLYPLERGRGASCGVAFLGNSATAGMENAEAGFRDMVASFGPFSRCLKDAKIEAVECGVVPIEPLKKMAYDRMLVVGDAAGQAFPLLVEGFRPAVESAILCSDVAAGAYSSGDFGLRRLEKYEREWKRRNGMRYLMERVSSDVAFGRSPAGWAEFTRKMRGMEPETVIQFVGGDLKDKTAVRKMLPKREALKALSRYLRYRFFDWL